MYFLIDCLILQYHMKLLRKFFSDINDSLHESLFHHFPKTLITFSKYKIKFLIVCGNRADCIIIKEDFKKISKQFYDHCLLLEIFMPATDSLIENPHNS